MTRQISSAVRMLGAVCLLGACRDQPAASSGSGSEAGAPGNPAVAGQVAPVSAGQGGTAAPLEPPAAVGGTGGMPGAAGSAGELVPPQPPLLENTGDPATCAFDCSAITSPLLRAPTMLAHAPPPISGGSMLATRDGKWLVAADPDRDQLYFVDTAARTLAYVRQLQPGDEPGRLIEDAAGRIHVAARSGHALLTLGTEADSAITRRAVCDLPRGMAYDQTRDALHVACAEGKVVTVPADPSGAVTRSVEVGRDVRDVLVRGDGLLVTRFRAAELLQLDAAGAVTKTLVPPSFTFVATVDPNTGMPLTEATNTPTAAWRLIDVPGKGAVMLHQRASTGEIQIAQGGYASGFCGGIVQTAVTIGLDGTRALSADLAMDTAAVDVAVDPTATMLAVAAPGNWGNTQQVHLYSMTGTSALNPLAPAQLLTSKLDPELASQQTRVQPCLAPQTSLPSPDGQATSLAFLGSRELAVFEREPAAISIIDLTTRIGRTRIDLAQASRFDTGHSLFHLRTNGQIACASCHVEGGDDSHVWTFQTIGARRTQSLRGGILGTEPLHWNGDMANFSQLVDEVFVKRMSGMPLDAQQGDTLAKWIDHQPGLKATPRDASQVARGKLLFESAAVGCATCHSGPLLTNNEFADVGTGGMLQVPALRAVSFRLPLMHNGCAKTLRQRFDAACGGGDSHGVTSQLMASELDDLIAYLAAL